MKGLKEFLSVLLVIILLSSQSFAFAQTPTPTQTPTPAITQTPTPTENPTYDETSDENSVEDANNEVISSDPDADPVEIEDSITDIIASRSATIDTTIENNNTATVDKDVTSVNNTGSNKALENIDIFNELVIKSGDATAEENHSNVLNTNVIGEDIITALLSFFGFEDNDIDYSDIQPCTTYDPILSSDINFSEAEGNKVTLTDIYQLQESLGITNNNDAVVNNNITVDALTGDNESLDNIARTSIQTGDADIDVALFNMLNTNLIGECGFFGVFNFFSPQTNSLILPYEKGFIDNVSETPTITSLNVVNTNTADSDTDIDSTANTGENELTDSLNFTKPATIYTGDSNTEQNVLDLTNLSYTLDNFLYLRIQHYGNWTGNLVGWDGLVFEGDDYYLLVKNNQPLPEFTEDEIHVNEEDVRTDILGNNIQEHIEEVERNVVIHNNNNASLVNNLLLNADTGHNRASNIDAEIRTGNANINADIFNLINTNIVGRNWFFGVINLFDEFSGDIVFPRTDVAVDISSNVEQVTVGNTVTYAVKYENKGHLPAENTSLVFVLPPGMSFEGASQNGMRSGQSLVWSLGTLPKLSNETIYVTAKVHGKGSLTANAVMHTTSDEIVTSNNADSHVFLSVEHQVHNNTNSNNSSNSDSSSSNDNNTNNIVVTPTPFIANQLVNQRIAGQFNQYSNIADSNDDDNEDDNERESNEAVVEDTQAEWSVFGNEIMWNQVIVAYLLGVVSTVIAYKIRNLLS